MQVSGQNVFFYIEFPFSFPILFCACLVIMCRVPAGSSVRMQVLLTAELLGKTLPVNAVCYSKGTLPMLKPPLSGFPGVSPETSSLWPPCTIFFFSRGFACYSPCQWQRGEMKGGPSETVASSNVSKEGGLKYTEQQRDQRDEKAIELERKPSRVKKVNKNRLPKHGGYKWHRCSYRFCSHGCPWG